MGLGPWCSLGWLLLLAPLPASAQARGRPAEVADPVCVRDEGVCDKLRFALVGGGLLTLESAAPGFGVKGGLSFVLTPRVELGVNFLGMTDVRVREGTYLGAGEGILRVAAHVSRERRLFVELSGGVSLGTVEGTAVRAFPAGTVGTSLEWANAGTGFFVTAGLTVLRAERWTALPHAGFGVAL